jgi:hypothetical protein
MVLAWTGLPQLLLIPLVPQLMKRFDPRLVIGVGFALFAVGQETVTIPKSRLEELERKEAELEKLKGSVARPQPTFENPTTQKQDEATPANSSQTKDSTPAPAVIEAPSFASLPALEKENVVSATDLAAHYKANAAQADGRYRKRTFRVQGEIVGFEKPMLVRNYDILLKTAEPQTRIMCDFYPPENFKAVYTINGGTVLVGTLPDTRVPMAKVGDIVVIEGRCKGLSGGGVKLTNCEMKGR